MRDRLQVLLRLLSGVGVEAVIDDLRLDDPGTAGAGWHEHGRNLLRAFLRAHAQTSQLSHHDYRHHQRE
uniref:Putative secreted protein n=1 Tax=Anopheles triannulatus TaxID=58253 RepID=A0A2M4B346_9DIPT